MGWDRPSTHRRDSQLDRVRSCVRRLEGSNALLVIQHGPTAPRQCQYAPIIERRQSRRARLEPESHRVDPEFGSTLRLLYRDFQSNCWVNLKILGQPCEFYL